jgi:CRISPR-associated protein Csb1
LPTSLDLKSLTDAVESGVAFRSITRLQPAAGEGTKVFPPTYAGAVYATEKRRLPERDEPVECVLLDSVQSQANRMEEALQQAIDEGKLKLPVIEVDFGPYYPGDGVDKMMRLLDPVGRVGTLQAPHRIADAILRDSLLDGQAFRDSAIGKSIGMVSARNATALFAYCPTALVFGMWDSTGPKGGLGAKFERALVGEIVGIDAVYGIKTSSRIDPLAIQRNAGPLYRRKDGGFTVDPDKAVDELKNNKPTGKKVLLKKNGKGQDVYHEPEKDTYPDEGRPSVANHGNVTPSFGKYTKGAEGRDPLLEPTLDLHYKTLADEKTKEFDIRLRDSEREAREGRIAPGGVTLSYGEQTVVLSLPALRRLRFPVNGKSSPELDNAARTVLAALGLCAASLAAENGLDLRSRCLLWPTQPLSWHLLSRPGESPIELALSGEQAIALLNDAVTQARELGLPWQNEPITLTPSDDLVKLVAKSQQIAAQQGADAGAGD